MSNERHQDWLSIATDPGDLTKREALQQLIDVGQQYERYLHFARLYDLTALAEEPAASPESAPTTDRPLGLVIDSTAGWSQPIGLQFSAER